MTKQISAKKTIFLITVLCILALMATGVYADTISDNEVEENGDDKDTTSGNAPSLMSAGDGNTGTSDKSGDEKGNDSDTGGTGDNGSDTVYGIGDILSAFIQSDNLRTVQLTDLGKRINTLSENSFEYYEDNQETIESISESLTRLREDETKYQTEVLAILQAINSTVSANTVVMQESISNNKVESISENMIEIQEETVSENETVETVSENEVYEDVSVSANDIAVMYEGLHEDLKQIYFVLIVATAFLTIIGATLFEQLIFKRMRS